MKDVQTVQLANWNMQPWGGINRGRVHDAGCGCFTTPHYQRFLAPTMLCAAAAVFSTCWYNKPRLGRQRIENSLSAWLHEVHLKLHVGHSTSGRGLEQLGIELQRATVWMVAKRVASPRQQLARNKPQQERYLGTIQQLQVRWRHEYLTNHDYLHA